LGNSQYYQFAEEAAFTDVLTSNEPIIGTQFNFTISGSSNPTSNIFSWEVYVSLGNPPPLNHGSGDDNFTVTAVAGGDQANLTIQLRAVVDLSTPAPVAGTNLSGTSDYLDTLTLDSVGLAPGQTLIGQSGINYGDLGSAPEPATWAIMLIGMGGMAALKRRR